MVGYAGNILHVDLCSGTIKQIPTEIYADSYLGGRGIATKLYWDLVPPEVGAFSPQNILVFMTGTFVGCGIPGANRMMIVGKSPLPDPEGFCYGNFGGFFPWELKRAGFDGIIITGASESPVYLWVENGQAQLRDASALWGKFPSEVERILKDFHGKGVKYLTIGPAGENLVHSAVIVGSHRSSSAGGLGAVMGSKKLKAIAVRGSSKISVSDEDVLVCLAKDIYRINKRLRLTIGPKIRRSGRDSIIEIVGNSKCPYCNLDCVAAICLYGKRLRGLRKCQSMEYYLPWDYSKADEPIDTLFDAPTLANEYGICTFELEGIVEWLFAMREEGVIDSRTSELPLEKIGTREFLEELLNSVSYRRGFGALLAEGLNRAGENWSTEGKKIFSKTSGISVSHHVRILARELVEARSYLVNMLLYQFEPRRSRPLLHHGFLLPAWHMHIMDPHLSPIDGATLVKISRLFWDSELAFDNTTYSGKGIAAVKQQNAVYINDSLGLCDWAYPLTYSLVTEDYIGCPNLEAKIYSAVFGSDPIESQGKLEEVANRIVTLQRMILIREGWKYPESDYPPEMHFKQPLAPSRFGEPGWAPGKDGLPVDRIGTVLDVHGYKKMLNEYYKIRGWVDGKPLVWD